MTLDASGNLCLGTTSPISTNLFSASSAASNVAIFNSTVSTSGGGGIRVAYNGTTELWMGYYSFAANTGTSVSDAGIGARSNLILDGGTGQLFSINGSEKARIDSSGNLLVGTTSNPNSCKIAIGPTASNGISIESNSTSVVMSQLLFRNPNGIVGSVSTAGSTTTYATSSDYRLKENVVPMTGALAKVLTLMPVTYNWKSDGSDGEGFIAHELQEVFPQAVVGEKDAVDENGNPKYQGIDTSFLVATLTAAIQEQQALITQLTARITALESA